jgi:hypothetical protein
MRYFTPLLVSAVFATVLSGTTYTFSDFSDPSGMTLLGDASLTDNRLRLTAAEENQVGAAWLNSRVDVQNGFTVTFQFQITDRGGHTPDWEPGVFNDGADGFTFTIQNYGPDAMGLYASGVGYYGIANSLAVEFDTWHNKPSYCEPNGNHVAVQSLGTSDNRPEHCGAEDGSFDNPTLAIATPGVEMSDGRIYNVMITYLPGLIAVYLEDMNVPLLTAAVDLGQLLDLEGGRSAFIGFTSSTGGAWENHDILRFSYNEVPEPATVVLTAGVFTLLALKELLVG